MRRLSAMDAMFLYMERPETPMHAAALQLFELPEGYRGSFFEEFKKHLVERAHLIPFFHQHLHRTPMALDHPVWVEDESFDLDYHLRHMALPSPGTVEELTRLAETLYPPLLDRSRPLWEYTIIEGLESGHVALFAKAHHACLDGMASRAMVETFYSHTPDAAPASTPVERPLQEEEPGLFKMLQSTYRHMIAEPRRALRSLPDTARAALKVGRRALDGRLPGTAPRTRFDVQATDRRRFAITSLSLARVKTIARANGCTVNDLVLAVCGGALRRYLAGKDELPEESLVSFAPVSLRAGDDSELNNQVFGMMSSLATDLEDPLERLAAVHESTREAKGFVDDVKGAFPSDYAIFGAPAVFQAAFGVVSSLHLSERMPQLFNVTVSNVPGLQMPLYVGGAKMVAQYPMSIVQHGCALNITVMGIQDSLDFGLVACARAVPDVEVLAAGVEEAFDELESASA